MIPDASHDTLHVDLRDAQIQLERKHRLQWASESVNLGAVERCLAEFVTVIHEAVAVVRERLSCFPNLLGASWCG